ncbi:hypothetical protein U9M48_025209 [Paspalum notatum var. saurae]|uniref:GRF-type domain-containing protein n=1 Tax=Paspalum notatum var. saurae TaxID=547442 RepID=A0AAQ3TT32_PASNO
MASSASSVGESSWCHGEVGRRKSPIPYRSGPLDYTPFVACHCWEKVALWISWSDENPGRRYLKCFRARLHAALVIDLLQSGGCNFISWFEGRVESPFVRGLLVDLRNAVWELKKERARLKDELTDAMKKIEEQELKMGRLLVALEEGRSREVNSDDSELDKKLVEKKRPWRIALWFALVAVVFFQIISSGKSD